MDDLRKNGEGYNDPTAYKAIKEVDRQQSEVDARFYKLLHTIFHMAELAGFVIEDRIHARDRRTGKKYE
jgi:hypothetical protein